MAEKVKCLRCGKEWDAGKNFCGSCGYGLPMGKITCPHCKAEIEAITKFCNKCGEKLGEVSFDFINKRWERGPRDFAIRVEPVMLQDTFMKDVIIDPGTKVLFFQDGKLATELGAGYYKAEGIFARIKQFLNIQAPASLLIMDSADVEIQTSIEGLFTKEGSTVGVDTRITIQLEKPELFFVNLFKGKDRYRMEDLEVYLVDQVKNVLQSAIKSRSMEELYGNEELKRTLEQSLESGMKVTLERSGFRIVQLRVIDYRGVAYDEIRKAHGELFIDGKWIDVTDARGKLNERYRQVLTADRMNEFKTEIEFEDFLRQQEHEVLGIRGVIRDEEMLELKRVFREHREEAEIAHDQMMDRMRLEHELAQKKKKILEERKITSEEADIILADDRKKRLQEIDMDEREALSGLKVLEGVKKVRLDAKERELKILSSASIEALIVTAEPEQARHLRELKGMILRKDMTPEQILAEAAKESPEAAKALAQKYSTEGLLTEQRMKDLQKMLEDVQKRDAEWADRLKETMDTALKQMGRTAEWAARAGQPQQTVVAGGGYGGTTVVSSGGVKTSGVASVPATKKCQKCGTDVPITEPFCGECGQKI